ncbi:MULTISPECIES: AGE family epimerase/isomerase [unclassified Roseitalea]|uniref:AGE family epimerase/isomerase n=1 Tax=unclassified Roseitalea TaxID=2639107 RepID=UPI00273D54FA|nr:MULTISPECIES: AGE family epimerase/isomerase [unclassified Roseitalea]
MTDGKRQVVTPVVLCGGAGSRLWPMSRRDKPKQFHALFDGDSLLANTLARMPPGPYGALDFAPPCVIGSATLADLLAAEMPAVHGARLVLEPAIRDTAAAIAACTALYCRNSPDDFLIVLPSDARIADAEGFRRTVARAAEIAARTDAIMTIGITPTRAETQYGYIEKGAPVGAGYKVRTFREKPDAQTARDYLQSGRFLWNAGIFLYRIGRMADAFGALQPQIWEQATRAVSRADVDGAAVRLDPESFAAAERVSIDYAIMEKADNIGVVPAQFDWDDLGSWAQLHDHARKDARGNAVSGDAVLLHTSGTYVRAEDAQVAVAGVDDLVIVAEDGKVLVTARDKAHLVKEVAAAIKARATSPMAGDRSPDAIRAWLLETCLPFWADSGIDRANGGVHEALAFDGTPAPHPQKRLRVLPRQIYCFAHGEHLGWRAPPGLLETLFETLVSTGWHADGGFIHTFHPDGRVRDARRDTYDQCFVLLATAWLWRVRGWPEARRWADRTLEFMDEALADPVHGGFREDSQNSRPRRANPHMHVLEAMLAWYEATGETGFLDRADAVIDLFERHFFDPETGTLTEFFADDWTPVTDGSASTDVEPGHHYEWAWLLLRHLGHRTRPGLEAKARLLFSTARALGHHAETGAAADTMAPDGARQSERARCWPQTEALKAALAFERRGLVGAAPLRAQMIDLLFGRYLGQPAAGGWFDAIDARGRVAAPDMPSSTLYHVMAALAEYLESGRSSA